MIGVKYFDRFTVALNLLLMIMHHLNHPLAMIDIFIGVNGFVVDDPDLIIFYY